ncbi:MAG TPA: transglycosylase family protein [Actinocrinis sp.]
MPATAERAGHRKAKTSRTRKIAAGALIAGVGVAVPLGAAATASASTDSVNWSAIANCESGGDWSIDTGNGFYGGLQFTESTWLAYGGGSYAQYPNQASESDQIAVAENVLAGQGIGAWPVCGANAGSGTDYSGSNTSGSSGSSSSSSSNDSSSSSQDTSSSSSSTGSTSGSSSSSSSGGNSYTVASGDTLSTIAQKLGVSDWHSLYNENTSVIGSNPDLIFPGQVLSY